MGRKHEFIFLQEAIEEMEESFDWYEKQSPGLGHQFYLHLDQYFDLIDENPNRWAFKYRNQRQVVVKKFPFVILFEWTGDAIIVFAVSHTSKEERNRFRK